MCILYNAYNLVFPPGECYTATECSGRGGSYTTSCANGLGVCCYIVQESCGLVTDVTLNNTYIRNPGYAGLRGHCQEASVLYFNYQEGIQHLGHALTK